ncbi:MULTISPECIES: TIR domain-containing protein [unclassified Streptomyces]|uniref:TIR domain-containing protein n=1 Tax=unclassified Streptomyces TaxID=2593676 RepID=UPI0022537002|nr:MULTISPECIES: TIR domain-containing protein [unclassified Streptomyces]MCX5330781.1 toll/interleukin-1 receptor domain-containing protein [Streptomyces sp. NBC_00140]MCX5360178.1 toll/interleukin-1 receptor domain-containing protein [Streptomyces sp. NBC_00124]
MKDGPAVTSSPYSSGAGAAQSRVLISYSSADRSWADWLAWSLSGWGHDVRHGAEPPSDAGGYALQVEDALRHVDVVIALLSPHYLGSPSWARSDWSSGEVAAATAQGRFAPVPVGPVDVEQVPDVLRKALTPALDGLDAEAARETLQYVLRRPRDQHSEPAYPGTAPGAAGQAALLQSQLIATLADSPLLTDTAARGLWTRLIVELAPTPVQFADHASLLTALTDVVGTCRAAPGGLSALVGALEMLDPEHPGLEEARRLTDEIELPRDRP